MIPKNPFRRGDAAGTPVSGPLLRKAATLVLLGLGTADVQAQQLTHRWSFTDLNDSVGTANATLNGTASLSGGQLVIPSGAARTNYAALPIGPTLATSDSLTIETWYTSTTNQIWAKVWMFGTPGANEAASSFIDYTPYVGIAGNFPSTGFKPAGAGQTTTRGGTNPAAQGTGTQILSTVVFDDAANEMRLYLNGVLADSEVWNGTISQLGSTTQNFLGAAVFYGDNCFNGTLNEVRIWKGAMSAVQVSANATAGPDTVPPHDPRIHVAGTVATTSSGGAITVNVPITNEGSSNHLSIDSATFGGTDAAYFTVSSPLPLSIAPGVTSNLALAFDPDGFTGNFAATVDIGSSDPFNAIKTVNLEVQVALPDISVAPPGNFGPVANDAPLQNYSLPISNIGQGELAIIDAIFIAGPAAPTHFQQFAVTRDFISEGLLIVAPGGNTEIDFTFDPGGVHAGTKSGILRLFSDDPDEGQLDIPISVDVTSGPVDETPPVLSHRWSFATDASDSVGSADAVLNGTAAVSGSHLVLGGTGVRTNHATIPIGYTIASASSLTVEAWFTPANATQTWAKLWMFGTPGSSAEQSTYADFTPRSGIAGDAPSASFRSPSGEVNTRAEPNPPALAASTQYHAVVVYDSNADLISCYLDGVLVDSVAWSGEIHELGNTTDNFIGGAVFFGDQDWAGIVNEMRIWTGAFTSANAAVSYSTGPEQLPDLNAVPTEVMIGSVTISDGNLVIGGVTGLVSGQSYHLETGTMLNDFAPVAGSTFAGGDPIPVVPVSGPRRFVRIVDGAAP
jgi:hypothetical protein